MVGIKGYKFKTLHDLEKKKYIKGSKKYGR